MERIHQQLGQQPKMNQPHKKGNIPLPGQETQPPTQNPKPTPANTKNTTNLYATLSIISFTGGLIFILNGTGLIGIILAIILGHIAKYQTKRTKQKGKPLATLSLTLSYITLILALIVLIAFAYFATNVLPGITV